MRKLLLRNTLIALLIAVVLLVGCSGTSPESMAGPKVLVYVRDGSSYTEYMLLNEIGVMLSMLEEAGIQAVVATDTEESYQDAETPLSRDILLSDVEVGDYDGFLLPCMAAGNPGSIAEEAITLVTDAAAQDKPIAAMHGTVPILAKAGLLDGKAYAYDRDRYTEGTYGGTGVVQDGNLITGGTCSQGADYYGRPDGTQELTQLFIAAIAP